MLLRADARHIPLADGTVQCCVTSPPYWGLRDYGVSGQIGLERTPDEYVAGMVAVFREVRRVMRDDGVLWLNLGDSYAGAPVGSFNGGGFKDKSAQTGGRDLSGVAQSGRLNKLAASGLKPKDLVGIPWRVAFALQADGWYLRQDIIWHKPNPMPESVRDRCTKAHEYVFLLAKSERYFYDAKAISEPLALANAQRTTAHYDTAERYGAGNGGNTGLDGLAARMRSGDHVNRNARSVWSIATQPYSGAHFATMPEALAERCILAGSRSGDLVLDPFGGSGTTARCAVSLGRRAVVTELNAAYLALSRERTQVTRGLPLEVSASAAEARETATIRSV